MKRLPAVFVLVLFVFSACSAVNTPQQPGAGPTQSPSVPKEQATAAQPLPPSTALVPSPTIQAKPGAADSQWIAVIKLDGNVSLVNAVTGSGKQITEDGNGLPQAGTSPQDKAVYYSSATWSTDGKLLAFLKTNREGTQWQVSIQVYNLQSGQTGQLLDGIFVGNLAFRPGTHLLAYDQSLDVNYFVNGKPDASKARGIFGLDADTGKVVELVRPERGLWLSEPRWSPDGNLLGFVEQTVYEDPAPFALYDFQNKAYHAWDRVIGNFAFAPDGKQVAYDRWVNGTVSGNERIWVSDLLGKDEKMVSPRDSMTYGPAWSPNGDVEAFKLGQPEVAQPVYARNVLVVQASQGGAVRELGSFAGAGPLAWSPDGTRLAFSSGPENEPHVKLVTVADGSVRDLGIGYEPVWQP